MNCPRLVRCVPSATLLSVPPTAYCRLGVALEHASLTGVQPELKINHIRYK